MALAKLLPLLALDRAVGPSSDDRCPGRAAMDQAEEVDTALQATSEHRPRLAKLSLMTTLVCVECQRESGAAAHGWQGHLVDLTDEGRDEVVFYCPNCAEREFSARPSDADEARS